MSCDLCKCVMMLSHLVWLQVSVRKHDKRWALQATSILPDKASRRLSELELSSESLCHFGNHLVPISKDVTLHWDFHVVIFSPIHDCILCGHVAHVSVCIELIETVEPLDIVQDTGILFILSIKHGFGSRYICEEIFLCWNVSSIKCRMRSGRNLSLTVHDDWLCVVDIERLD